MESAAILTIKRPGTMTKRGRAYIAKWLRRQALLFEKHGDVYSKTRFTARYLYG